MRGRLRTWIREARRRWGPKGVVLMYHRVADSICDPWDLCVSPERFDAQLKVLARDYQVVPLTQLLAEHRRGCLGDRTVAITFDDGYADNLHAAAEILVRQGLPATFFIASGAVGSTHEFWWDRLERCLLGAAPLPDRLTISGAGWEKRWELGAARLAYDATTTGDKPWEVDPATRLGFFYAVWKHLQSMEESGREDALHVIEDWSGTDREPRGTHRILSEDEVRALARLPGMVIGAHSVTHAALSTRDPSGQSAEILRSKHDLERLTGCPVSLFAYPFGDYDSQTPKLVQAAGFDGACIADPGIVWAKTDAYLVPRVAALDWDDGRFSRELAMARR